MKRCKTCGGKKVMIPVISLLSSCCGDGLGYSNFLYAKFKDVLPDVGLMGFTYDEANTLAIKYKVKREDLPIIIIDEIGVSFGAEQVHDEKFLASLIEKIKPAKEIVKK
jgi:galactitol-specific phosphotransferase system IIB component